MSTPEDLTGSLKYISDFDETNPPNTGQAPSYGDDHIRGIKNAIKNTFPNIDAPVTATEDELNNLDGYTGNTADLNILSGADTAGVTSTEFQYLNGVTSAIQTQLDGKQATDATITALGGTLTAANKIPYATGVDTAGELDLLDEDDMVSDSATGVPTQQSAKAYIDAQVATAGGAWELVDLGGTSNPWTPTAVNSKDFTWDESLYSRILIVAEGLVPATDGVSLRLRLGHTNGTVVLSGTDDYGYIARGPSGSNFNLTDNESGLDTFIITGWSGSVEGVVGSNNDEGISLDIALIGMGSTRSSPRVRIESTWLDASGAELISDVSGVVTDASGDSNQFDTVRLYWSSGNFETQGNIYVYGLKRA